MRRVKKKTQKNANVVYQVFMLKLALERGAKVSLVKQVHDGISTAIREGRLEPGARLPSWRDLASQLGVSRGTVKAAYERLADDQLVLTAGSAGTRVVDTPPLISSKPASDEPPPLPEIFRDFDAAVDTFQMGVPSQDEFPFKTWSRIVANAAKASARTPARYPDPRGEPSLRREIAAYLAIARGIVCSANQIIVTSGYGSALSLVARVLGKQGASAIVEDPGYPLARAALGFCGISVVPVPVDAEGISIERAASRAPEATLALVSPGQQAPLGMTMSLKRRQELMAWAEGGRWIIEDDYLGELQLKGRAAPALASLDQGGKVIHIGTFSKTISPTVRVGFLVAPPSLVSIFGDAAASTAPAPAPCVQEAVAEFIHEGHYLRHIRRLKRLYAARRDALRDHLRLAGARDVGETLVAGTTIVLRFTQKRDDVHLAALAQPLGLAPAPLSPWFAQAGEADTGMLLSVTNYAAKDERIASSLLGLLTQA